MVNGAENENECWTVRNSTVSLFDINYRNSEVGRVERGQYNTFSKKSNSRKVCYSREPNNRLTICGKRREVLMSEPLVK
jgi:hypothetical protein